MKPLIPALLILALSLPVSAETPTKDAATTSAPATKAAEKDKCTEVLIKAAKDSFVIVEFWYKKDLSEPTTSEDRNWRTSEIYEDYIDKKRPEERTGVVLDKTGRILVVDDGLEDRFLDKIVVKDGKGGSFPAKRQRLLFNPPGIVLKVGAKAAAKLTPIVFTDVKDNGPNTKLFGARLYKADDQWRIATSPLQPSVTFTGADKDNTYYGYRSSGRYAHRSTNGNPVIIANADGEPVGVRLTSFMDLKQEECIWKGRDLLKGAKGMDWPALKQAEKICRKQLITSVHEIVIKLRQTGGGDYDSPYENRYGGASGQEITTFGIAISPTEILIPRNLTTKMALAMDKLYVKVSPRIRRRADFVGAYKGFGAFVIRLRKGRLPAHVKLSRHDLPRMLPFWAAHSRKRFGKTYVDLTTNRIFGKQRGYAGKYHWYAGSRIRSGSMLVNLKGELTGLYLHERIEHEEERRLQRSQRYSYSQPQNRIFMISELRKPLTNIKKYMNPKVMVKSKTAAKRRAWFGIEYVPMTKDLAEHFKVEQPTKDGRLGFLVNAVYPNSPAEKMGVKVGDIVLRLHRPGMTYPIDLSSRFARSGSDYYGMRSRWMRYTSDSGNGPPSPSWKSRKNILTRAMDTIGVGNTITIEYTRPVAKGQAKTIKLTYKIVLAPQDMESAPKWQNRKLGLTVKDVTYEVRYGLHLKKTDPGVIVAKVEEGSPMQVAKIWPGEIITRLDEVPLHSARQMRDLVAKAHKAGKKKVRLTILRLGKTRFADLAVGSYKPADDEGLDEKEEIAPLTAIVRDRQCDTVYDDRILILRLFEWASPDVEEKSAQRNAASGATAASDNTAAATSPIPAIT